MDAKEFEDKLNDFFCNISKRVNFFETKTYYDKVSQMSDEDLKAEYVKLKSISEGNEKIIFGFLTTIFLSVLGGTFSIFNNFVKKLSLVNASEEEVGVVVSGSFLLFFVLAVIFVLIFLFCLFSFKRKKRMFYYVELEISERKA